MVEMFAQPVNRVMIDCELCFYKTSNYVNALTASLHVAALQAKVAVCLQIKVGMWPD